MQFRRIPSAIVFIGFLWLTCSFFSSAPSFAADDGDEILQDLTKQCRSLARDMAQREKEFPQVQIEKIKGLVTWHAALCGERPKANGTVVALCDGHLPSGKNIFFWQMKTKAGELKSGFSVCK